MPSDSADAKRCCWCVRVMLAAPVALARLSGVGASRGVGARMRSISQPRVASGASPERVVVRGPARFGDGGGLRVER